MTKRITIKDVAKHAGISYQTVSRVINDKPDVSPETRKRVLDVIDELNYRPSMAATSRASLWPVPSSATLSLATITSPSLSWLNTRGRMP